MPFSAAITLLRRFHPRSSPVPVAPTPTTTSPAISPRSFSDGCVTPSGMNEVPSRYLPVSVRLDRPGVAGAWGARFELVAPPPRPLTLGISVCLEIRWYDDGAGHPWLVAQPTRGRLIALAGMRSDAIEFVLRNDTPDGEYEYLLCPVLKSYVALPPRLFAATILLGPYLIPSAAIDHGRTPETELTEYLPPLECGMEHRESFMSHLELVGYG